MKNIQAIINPKIDFLPVDDLLNNVKYMRLVYNKVFSECANYIEHVKELQLEECNLRKSTKSPAIFGQYVVKLKDKTINIKLEFNKDIIGLYIDNKHVLDSNIFGARINKELQKATSIKVDLASIKEKIKEVVK